MRDLVWRVFYMAFWPLIALVLVRVRREGPRLPAGPVILVPNHCSFMDPVVVQGTSWRHVSFLMTEVFYRPWPVRWFFAWMGAIPVNEGRGNREALGAAIAALRRGACVSIFPEGQIARDGKLQRFHPGVASIALATGAPVVPVAIHGSFEAYPRHAAMPKFCRRVTVRYGAPIAPPAEDVRERARKELLRVHTERIRAAVLALLEPRYRPAAETAAPAVEATSRVAASAGVEPATRA